MCRLCFLAILFAAPAIAGPLETYLALGDSIAFGQTDIIPVSLGDQGYVTLYADFLAKQNAGVRPNVANLAFPGDQHELSSPASRRSDFLRTTCSIHSI